MRRIGPLILLSGGLLWGCAAPGGPDGSPAPAAGTGPAVAVGVETAVDAGSGAGSVAARDPGCAAARHRSMIGRPIGEVDTAALPGPLRVYRAGSAVTGDHRPERMNIVVGPDGRVVRVGCG